MDEIFVYIVDLPDQINEYVMPCADGWTIYIDARLDAQARAEAYRHALGHIEGNDWKKTSVQEIEAEAHERSET